MIYVDIGVAILAVVNVLLGIFNILMLRRVVVLNRLLGSLCIKAFVSQPGFPAWEAWARSFGWRFELVDSRDEG